MIRARSLDGTPLPPLTVGLEEVTDPVAIAHGNTVMEAYSRNEAWLQAHRDEVIPLARGKILAVAGQEAFIAATIEEALAMARAAHPEDGGILCRYVSPQTGPKIYALRR